MVGTDERCRAAAELYQPARRPIFAARLAFRTRSADAPSLSASTAELYANDAGYVADRASWLRDTGDSLTARSWLARSRQLTTRPGNVEIYEALLVNARAAANDGQLQTAYDIARQVDDAYPVGTDVSTKPYGERDDYTSLVWLAGQTAMKLARPADAMTLFDRYGRGSQSPQTRAKGFTGRAARRRRRVVRAMRRLSMAGPRNIATSSTANWRWSEPAARLSHHRRSPRPMSLLPSAPPSTRAKRCVRPSSWVRSASGRTRPPSSARSRRMRKPRTIICLPPTFHAASIAPTWPSWSGAARCRTG